MVSAALCRLPCLYLTLSSKRDMYCVALLVFTHTLVDEVTAFCMSRGGRRCADPREATRSNLNAVVAVVIHLCTCFSVVVPDRNRNQVAHENLAAIRTQKQARSPCWTIAPIFDTYVRSSLYDTRTSTWYEYSVRTHETTIQTEPQAATAAAAATAAGAAVAAAAT